MRTNKTQKTFSCPSCLVDFQITIEPSVPYIEEEIEKNYPKSIEWLKEIEDCPVCGYSLIEEEEI